MSAPAKHVPMRRCVACRRSRPQGELLRFCRDEGGAWQLDAPRRAGGRGAWVCADSPACWTPKRLGRTFRAEAERVSALLTARGATTEAEKNPNLKMEA